MKKFILIMALLAVAVSAVAQPKGLSKEDKERFFNGKAKMMQKELKLSDEQMEKFLPVYKSFQEELKGIKRNREKADSLTMDIAYADVIDRLDYQEKVIKVQKNTLKELKSVLTPFQMIRFLDAERNVQKKIMDHKRGRKEHREKMDEHRKRKNEHRKSRREMKDSHQKMRFPHKGMSEKE